MSKITRKNKARLVPLMQDEEASQPKISEFLVSDEKETIEASKGQIESPSAWQTPLIKKEDSQEKRRVTAESVLSVEQPNTDKTNFSVPSQDPSTSTDVSRMPEKTGKKS